MNNEQDKWKYAGRETGAIRKQHLRTNFARESMSRRGGRGWTTRGELTRRGDTSEATSEPVWHSLWAPRRQRSGAHLPDKIIHQFVCWQWTGTTLLELVTPMRRHRRCWMVMTRADLTSAHDITSTANLARCYTTRCRGGPYGSLWCLFRRMSILKMWRGNENGGVMSIWLRWLRGVGIAERCQNDYKATPGSLGAYLIWSLPPQRRGCS